MRSIFLTGTAGLLALTFMVLAKSVGASPRPSVGESCHSSDPERICLGIKYVVYRDLGGAPVVTRAEALANIRAVNRLFASCAIAFQVDHYLAVDPLGADLRYRTATLPELDDVRSAFEERDSLLVVTTGPWDRSGSLGGTQANAWTAMPGSGLYGTILEASVGTYSNLIAHELGHYLNLEHVNDSRDLMNGITYARSTAMQGSQCATVRATASAYWKRMYR